MRRAQTRFQQAVFVSYLSLIFLLPWPLGSNRPWFWLPATVWALALLACVPWIGNHQTKERLNRARWPLALLAMWLGYHLFQWLPWFGESLSVDRHATLMALLRTILYSTLFLLAMLLPRGRRGMRALLIVIVVSGLLQGAFGSLMTLSGIEWGLLGPKEFGIGVATGTFVNRNHLAGCLEIALAAGVGLLMGFASTNRQRALSMRVRLRRVLAWALGPGLLLRLSLVVLVIALILTRSRMGNIAFLTSFLLVAVLAWVTNPASRGSLKWLIASLLVIDLVLLGVWFGVDEMVVRIGGITNTQESTGMSELGIRLNVNAETLEAIRQAPWLGYGGGTYYTVFPAFKSADLRWYYDHAHNDYLELWLEYGVIGLLVIGAFAGSVLRHAWQCLYSASRNARAVALAATMAMLSLMVHGLADFNLQIPSNAGWLMALLGVVLAKSYGGGLDERSSRREGLNSPAA